MTGIALDDRATLNYLAAAVVRDRPIEYTSTRNLLGEALGDQSRPEVEKFLLFKALSKINGGGSVRLRHIRDYPAISGIPRVPLIFGPSIVQNVPVTFSMFRPLLGELQGECLVALHKSAA